MTAARISERNLIALTSVGSGILLLLFTAGGFVFVSGRFAVGVLAGGCLILANQYWLLRAMRRALNLQPHQAASFAALRFLLRLMITAGLVYVLVVEIGVDIFGLLVGLSVLVITITVLAIYLFAAKGEI
ncbi:hypothetical protein GURASL_36840 [Geotalea uraniireducens]|uniref:ATP synthase subunit I n=1 Tax=Geotalea uraniireducens TaxID=351604 RepID=A0ABM8EQJ2_9BACT|nr:ATP synthase subunit I [Geotalea uraniireducens]BDV44761.1 hypothetical protein GURASL_36840 [Geotalea uraniireducens]